MTLALGAVMVPATILSVGASGAISSHSTKGVIISSVRNAKFGTILVSGRTVYTLKSNDVACGAKCLKYWPEVILPKGVSHATAGRGVNASMLGTLARPGGVLQVTYAGQALYWFLNDTAPGQAKGNIKDTWGQWSVVVIKALTPPPTTTTSAVKPGSTTTAPTTTTTVKPATTTTAPPGGGGGGGGVGF